ncbi:hypothetical protein B0H63DRAFT_509616 [Podospora didyma]|uniref:Major facilitator superfamily (MFS) profile domain-containing protein n=1 Tax=Podospora didyma TaxID=330526 RepID=A0AAE0U294_9PEZI|nr:hypothetical protein B0H63DRAFT_509616 [Podospora didyma]
MSSNAAAVNMAAAADEKIAHNHNNNHEQQQQHQQPQIGDLKTAAAQTEISDTEKDTHYATDHSSVHAQRGVQKIEAAAQIWTKWHLIAAYGMIWLIYFVTSTQEVVIQSLSTFVTSSFAMHSLTPVAAIIGTIVAGVSKLALAKLLDIWGRPQGLAVMLTLWTIGFIMMAKCENVETYAAAEVFTLVGAQGVSYCITVFVADTSALRNRGLMLAFATSPYIVTTWIGGPMAQAFIHGSGWRWGFGTFCIVTPIVVTPLILLFAFNTHRAKKLGLVTEARLRWNPRAVWDFAIEFDFLGVLLLAGGMALILLPLSLWSYQPLGWKQPMIIAMLVVGFVLVCLFVAYEKLAAPVNFIPMHLLGDRTILFAGLMLFFVFFNSAVWGGYFVSMLMVVWNTGVTKATYISNIYRVGSCFSALVLGYLIQRTGRFKWVATYYGLPLMMLGVGLMLQFRQPDADIGYVVMTQIFVAFAGGPIVVSAEIAMMSPLEHQHVAAILAILDLFGSIGYAVGSGVAGAIWTNTFPGALLRNLPEGTPQRTIDNIYSSIYSQLGYRMGTPIRIGVGYAYAEAQRYMLITSMVALALAWGCSWMWRDIKLKELKQVKGNVV